MQTQLLAGDGIDQSFEEGGETGWPETTVARLQGRETRISSGYP
jgi:hypothetical protein